MARRLVEGMSGAWKPEEHRDTYHEDLLALIEKRVQAGQTEEVTEPSEEEKRPRKGEVVDLMALLKKSVEEKGKVRRPQAPAKARGRKSGRKAA
jgi:DNA end-binding protein Ku